MRELHMKEHAAVSLFGAHSGACSVDVTSRLRRQALFVHGSTSNDARSFTPWYLVETEQFFPTCRTQMNTVWPVSKGPYGPSLRSSVCVLVVFGDLFVFNVAILMNYKLRVLRHAAFQVTFVAKRSQTTCVRGRRVGQHPLDCLTP